MIQKILATLMTYSISLQLIVGGIPVAMFTSTSAQANQCPQGLEWNSILNRCLTSRQAAQVQSASNRCFRIADKATQTKCFNDAIATQLKSEEGNIGEHQEVKGAFGSLEAAGSILLTMAGIYGSASALKHLTKCPGATSAWIMAGAAAAVLAGEVMSGHQYKKKIDSYKEDFDKLMAGTSTNGPSEIQSESINVMIKKEEATISAAKLKNTLYNVSTAAYSAAAVMAIYEMFKEKTLAGVGTTCTFAGERIKSDEKKVPDGKTNNVNLKQVLNRDSPPFELIEKKESQKNKLGIENPYVIYQGEILSKSINSSKVLDYIDIYFQKNRNSTYKEFYKTSHIQSVKNWNEYYFAMTDLKSFREGNISSSSVEDYESVKHLASRADVQMSNEEFSLVKLATKISEQFMVPDAHAFLPFGALGMILGMGAISAAGIFVFKKASNKIAQLYERPITRLGLSAVFITSNAFMISHTKKAIETAEKRKEFLGQLKTQIEVAGNGFNTCTPEQRQNDMSKPQCYCYLQGGNINTARVKSATCKAFFGSGLYSNLPRPTGTNTVREAPTCTTPNATVLDESCSCRRTNTCTTIPRASFSGMGMTSASIGNIDQTVDALNSGRIDAASIDPQRMIAAGAALQKKRDALLNDPKNKELKNNALKANAMAEKLMRDIGNTFANTPSLMNGAQALAATPSFGGAGSPEEELKKLQEDFKKDMKKYEPGAIGGSEGTMGAATDDFNLDAVSGGGVSIAEDEKLAEVMDANFDAGGSDINSNSDANIFQILTYRYQRSAMRRLFGGEAMLPADKANESEISE